MIGSVLKKIRISLKLSQSEVAYAADIKREALSMIENNRRGVSSDMAKSLLDIYKNVGDIKISAFEMSLLENYIIDKNGLSKTYLTKIASVDEITKLMKYDLNIKAEDKLVLFDKIETNIVEFLIENNYL